MLFKNLTILLFIFPCMLFCYNKEYKLAQKLVSKGLMEEDYSTLYTARESLLELANSDSVTISLCLTLANVDFLISDWNDYQINMYKCINRFPEEPLTGKIYQLLGICAKVSNKDDPSFFLNKAISFYESSLNEVNSIIETAYNLYYLGKVDEALTFLDKINKDEIINIENIKSNFKLPVDDIIRNYKEEREKYSVSSGCSSNDNLNKQNPDPLMILSIDSIKSFIYKNFSEINQYSIQINLNDLDTKRLEIVTSKNIGKDLSIRLKDIELVNAKVKDKISSGSIIISNFKSSEESEMFMKKLLEESYEIKLKK